MQNYEKTEFKADRLSASPLAFVPDSAKFDLTLEAVESDGRLDLSLEYAVKLFRMKTAEKWLDDFVRVLQAVASDPNVELHNVTLDNGAFHNQPLALEDVDFNF
jgi:surfactin family lipopeptide synthetase B/lichenysin synthetase B